MNNGSKIALKVLTKTAKVGVIAVVTHLLTTESKEELRNVKDLMNQGINILKNKVNNEEE